MVAFTEPVVASIGSRISAGRSFMLSTSFKSNTGCGFLHRVAGRATLILAVGNQIEHAVERAQNGAQIGTTVRVLPLMRWPSMSPLTSRREYSFRFQNRGLAS